jgi:hypothetical protein
MSEVLDAWFRNDENVTIDNDPLSRKYKRFGKCLIGFSHGDKEKKRLGKIMPVEARKDWGETIYCEIHAGHLHSEQAVKEENGVIVRYLSSPSGTDNWHFESGYVGAIKKAQSFVWDKDKDIEFIYNEIHKLKGRMRYGIYDKDNLLSDKDSPCDKGKEVWVKLYNEYQYKINK